MVRGHVAHDRQPEPRAARLPAARLVDAVEPLEHPVDVARRDAGTVVLDGDVDPAVGVGRGDHHRAAGIAELHRVVDQVGQGRHQLAAVADRLEVRVTRPAQHGHLPLGGHPCGPLDSIEQHLVDVDGTLQRPTAELDARQLEQIVDRPRRTMGLVDHARRQAANDLGIVAVRRRLGEHGERADRRLQLVTDVGDEVGADRVQPGALADVVDRGEREAVDQRLGMQEQHPPGRTGELDRPRPGHAVRRVAQQPLDGRAEQHRLVAGEAAGGGVAHLQHAVTIGEHDAGRQGIERGAQAVALGLRRVALAGGAVALQLDQLGGTAAPPDQAHVIAPAPPRTCRHAVGGSARRPCSPVASP